MNPENGAIDPAPPMSALRAAATRAATVLALALPAFAQAQIRCWGDEVFDSAHHGEAFVQIAAGASHTLGLHPDGTIAAWGDDEGDIPTNSIGQCQDVPALPPGLTYVEIAAGAKHSVARRSDGSAVAWGLNINSQCNIPALPAGMTYVAIAAGGNNTVLLRSDGAILVKGTQHAPVPALPPGRAFVDVAAGSNHCLALVDDGSALAWGDDTSGQCRVPPLRSGQVYVEIAGGGKHSLARRNDGTIAAWGDDSAGQCEVPQLPPGISYVRISAGGLHSLALRSDGRVVGWGDDTSGQCKIPPPPAGERYVDVAAGGYHSVVRRRDGSVAGFGANGESQCNAPALPPGLSYTGLTPANVALRSDGVIVSWDASIGQPPPLPSPAVIYVEVAAHFSHALARRSDGTVVAWGYNTQGECDVPPLPPGLSYVEVAAGWYHSLARRSDGAVIAWGDNSSGQLNVPALPPGVTYTQISAGSRNGAAVRSDGSIVGWGNGGDAYGVNTPLPLPPGLVYVEVETSGAQTLARRSDGSAVAWGWNFNGECNVPPLPNGVTYVKLAVGSLPPPIPPMESLALGLRSDGTLVAWGPSYPFGQTRVPELPPGFAYVDIAARAARGCATYARASTALAPKVTRVAPQRVDALVPGTEHTIALSGAGLQLTKTLRLDGAAIERSRWTILGETTISLDLPQVASLGLHELAADDGESESTVAIEVVAPPSPRFQLANGDALASVAASGGLSYIAAGPVGSVQIVYGSRSSVPSTNAQVSLGLGNHFASLFVLGAHAIPPAGWLRVDVPSSALPHPAPGGTALFAQAVERLLPGPFAVSNLQSAWLIP